MTWILFAILSAFFAGSTAILIKVGLKRVDSNLATALRTAVVLGFSAIFAILLEARTPSPSFSQANLLFLLLSGLSTAFAWLSYFKALQLGDASRVVVVDKSSIIITILLSFIVFKEKPSITVFIGMLLIAAGILLMLKKGENENTGRAWQLYAFLSAIFVSLTAIFGKIGVGEANSAFATAVRTLVVFVVVWAVVLGQKKHRYIKSIDKKSWLFIVLSGITTGLAWFMFFLALKQGRASVVVSIEKLNIIVTVLFSRILLREALRRRFVSGLLCLILGTVLMFFV